MTSSQEDEKFEDIRWDFDEETGIGSITLDRPEKLNAMSPRTLRELEAAFERFEAIDRSGEAISVKVVVIEGAGDRAFSSGVDLQNSETEHYPYVSQSFRDALFTVRDYGAPVVAKIDGYCIGGGFELALLGDFRIASERSEIGFPEIELGIFPSTIGTTQIVPRIIGHSRAKELFMTGEFLSGNEAEAEGLIDHVHEHTVLDDEVEVFLQTLTEKPPLAIRAIKDTVDKSRELGVTHGTEYEYQAYLPLLQTEDYAEGMAAWAEDRDPNWQGR